MSGSVFKRCSCTAAELTDPATGKRLTCSKRHGKWWYNRKILDHLTGKPKQVTKGGFATRKDAEHALTDLNSRIDKGTFTDDHGITVADWLDRWLRRKIENGAAYSTEKVYRQHITDYLVPHLGHIRLSDLRPMHVDALLKALRETKGSGGKVLSTTTITRVHACLRSALSTALKMHLISYNPARDVELPRATKKRVHPWEPAEIGAFLDHVEGHRLGSLFHLIAFTGLRRGEALGLRWADVDLGRGVLVVRQQLVEKSGMRFDCEVCGAEHRGWKFTDTKTEAGSHRVVELDSGTVAVLLHHRLQQDMERTEWADAYLDHGLVFPRENGTPCTPSAITELFHTLTDQVTMPGPTPNDPPVQLRRVRLHDLRHGAASTMLAAGVDMNVISKRLGHSRSSFTADTYAHMLEGVGRDAAEKAAALIPRRGQSEAPLEKHL